MRVEIFSICDAATADGGKLNILGGFDTIWAGVIPAVHPQCALALRLRFDSSEGAQHGIVVNFVDFDGKHIMPAAHGTITLQFALEQKSASANLVLNIQMLRIERLGEHSIDLLVDGVQVSSIPLFVRKSP